MITKSEEGNNKKKYFCILYSNCVYVSRYVLFITSSLFLHMKTRRKGWVDVVFVRPKYPLLLLLLLFFSSCKLGKLHLFDAIEWSTPLSILVLYSISDMTYHVALPLPRQATTKQKRKKKMLSKIWAPKTQMWCFFLSLSIFAVAEQPSSHQWLASSCF